MLRVDSEPKKNLLKNALVRGFFVSLLVLIILIFLLTLIFQFTVLSESLLETFGKVVLIISIMLGGIQAAKMAESRFLLHGFGVGVLYLFFILSAGYFFNFNLLGINFLKKLLYCTISGALGGLIGAVAK
ncbi:MAG: TIGR04086 family membrane protein [Bacillota bacterium]